MFTFIYQYILCHCFLFSRSILPLFAILTGFPLLVILLLNHNERVRKYLSLRRFPLITIEGLIRQTQSSSIAAKPLSASVSIALCTVAFEQFTFTAISFIGPIYVLLLVCIAHTRKYNTSDSLPPRPETVSKMNQTP